MNFDSEKLELIKSLSLHRCTKEEFVEELNIGEYDYQYFFLELFHHVYSIKNADYVEFALATGAKFGIFNNKFVDILCKLLKEKWHYRHEDIVNVLQGLKSPQSVQALYEVIFMKYDYLHKVDECHALARKCTWALGEIGTQEAYDKLLLVFYNTEDEYVKAVTKKQLIRRGLFNDEGKS